MFLGHTIDPLGLSAPDEVGIRRAQFFSSSDPYPEGDPRNDIERYDLISGQGVPQRETSKPADYRYVISAGPFESLPPDTFLTFQTAFVVGQGKDGMIDNAIQAQLIFDGVWRNADLSDETGAGGAETCIRPPGTAGSVEYVSPCDTTGTSIRIDWPGYCAPSTYVDDDCEGCTPLATRTEPGPETRVNWVGTVAPAPPATNTDGTSVSVNPGGNRRVVLQWDNLSELKADPIQRRILFEGYRIWRVEGWNRPVGSTGPAPEEWQKIAEFVRHPLVPPDICRVQDPEIANATISFAFSYDYLGNWEPTDPRNALPDDPCEACPEFCWPNRPFYVDDTVDTLEVVATGDTTPGFGTAERYDIGRYTFVDDAGIKNGMIYFYDVTAFSAWDEVTVNAQGDTTGVRHFELSGRPAAREQQRVVPTWPAQDSKDEIYVVPNPYVQSDRTVLPWGWDLIPSNSDPTGTRIAFTDLPIGRNVIKIYTLAGDLVETIETRSTGENGTAFWNLVSRNGQDVTAGVYLYTVKTESRGVKVGRFVVVR